MLEEGLHDRLQFDSDDGGQPSDTSYVRLLAAGKPEQGLIRFIEGSDSSDLWSTQGLASICSDSEDITRKRDAHPSRQVFGQSVADPKGVESIMKDSCHICEDVITWESPGDATPCCGRLVHDQCNYEAIEECGKCPACGWVQESSKNAVTTAPLEPQEYMFRFGDRDRSTQTNG